MFEAVPDNADVFKIRVLTEDENGDFQPVDIVTTDNGNFYYKWYSKS